MIIRSQNKKNIANMNCIDTITIIGEEIRYFYGSENGFGILGYYSTEEKAIKVLDMIQKEYIRANDAYSGSLNIVFQMPQDSEV